VRDDGAGFDAGAARRGRGVDSMRSRIARLGGTLILDSAPGRGTDLRFRVPLAARSPIKMRWPWAGRRGTS
jgi:signal transduction histidine kinase